MPPQIPTFLKVGERLRLVKRSGINDIFDLLRRSAVSRIKFRPAAVSRFKFAVPIVVDMRNFRYRRRQFDSADSEFGDLEKTEYKGNPLLSGSGFQFVDKPLVYRKWGRRGIATVQVVSHLCHCICALTAICAVASCNGFVLLSLCVLA